MRALSRAGLNRGCGAGAGDADVRRRALIQASGRARENRVDFSRTSPGEAGRIARTVMPWVDVVLGNEEEFSLLTDATDTKAQVAAMLDAGAKLLIRKLGSRGVEAHTRNESYSALPYPMRVTCAIGGGDGFATGFLYALYKGQPLQECLRYGNAAAAVVVSRISCADSMPRLEELEGLLHATASIADV